MSRKCLVSMTGIKRVRVEDMGGAIVLFFGSRKICSGMVPCFGANLVEVSA